MTGEIGRKDVPGSHSYREQRDTDPCLSLQLLAQMVPATRTEGPYRKSGPGQYGKVSAQ